MNNLAQSMSMLYKLKEMGFKLSLDDFGTGYSSLNYLKNIPIDKVKARPQLCREHRQEYQGPASSEVHNRAFTQDGA